MSHLSPLLTHLAAFPANGRFHKWHYERMGGSANNVLYRATSPQSDVAVKFTIADARRRAWREFQALKALPAAGLTLAPTPLRLDETTYAQPVVVQSWLDGEVTAAPPQTDADWQQLVAHYAALTAVTPQTSPVALADAIHNFRSPAHALKQIEQQLTAVPPNHQPDPVRQLIDTAQRHFPPATNRQPLFANIPITLCRVDPNTLNFVRRPDGWRSVDWENSGWGDPAFEMADLMAHPKYTAVPPERWQWLKHTYQQLTGDKTAVTRIDAYYPLMLVWWVARFTRALYEVPRGQDQRLAPRRADWQENAITQRDHYLARAKDALSRKFI